ncbi:MAG: peptidoglycan bridge formation protein FemAB [Candidatus Marinimicrobia bacterium]|nr:peptidoglycan bridge formation protein FemAB [Candidatus Neomarinimicrobiota bacterium]
MANHQTYNFAIVKYQQSDKAQWNEYVDNHENGTFFHLAEWAGLIKDVFSHIPRYILAKNSKTGDVLGVLPLVEQKSKLFGHSLISTPFCVYGGAIAHNDSIREALENKALEIGQKLSVDYVELRYKAEVYNKNFDRFCHHSTFGGLIPDGRDNILAGVKKKQRANIRHSFKKALDIRIDDDAETAYDVYSESVRNLGTPVFHPQYFPSLFKHFGNKVNVLTVERNGKPVSSVLSFYYKDEVLPYYGGGTTSARTLKSNDLMYFELMCHAHQRGCQYFDFGRSKDDSGAFKYKATWGMQPEPLHYMRALVKATEHPNLSPNNPKYALVINTWKKLPLWVSRVIGPYLSKYLG